MVDRKLVIHASGRNSRRARPAPENKDETRRKRPSSRRPSGQRALGRHGSDHENIQRLEPNKHATTAILGWTE